MTNATMTERTLAAIQETLAGRGRAFSALLFVGPAVIASIAYMDPGNFATNIQAGARYGYALLWVALLANVIAMLFQALSAKLGIVTRRNLAEMCRDRLPQPVVYALWGVSEFAAMATDLAEFIGGAIGLSLLLHIPMMVGMGVVAVLTFAHPACRALGLPADRARHRRLRRDHRPLLSRRARDRAGRLGRGRPRRDDADPARRRRAHPRGRHDRRDRDAARDLPALRPRQRARRGAQRRRAAHAAPFLQSRGDRRPDRGGARQHRHDHHGRERLPRRTQRRRRDRDGLFDADADPRPGRSRGVPHLAPRLGHIELGGRHHGGADGDAGLRRLQDSGARCAASSP